MKSLLIAIRLVSISIILLSAANALAGDTSAFPNVIEKIKPAIVGVGVV